MKHLFVWESIIIALRMETDQEGKWLFAYISARFVHLSLTE